MILRGEVHLKRQDLHGHETCIPVLGMKHTEMLDKKGARCGPKRKEVIAGKHLPYDVCVFLQGTIT